MNAGAVAAWDQAFAGHSDRLDRLVESFREGAGQFDELTNLGGLAQVLTNSEQLTRADVADMLTIAISRLASGSSVETGEGR